MSLPKTIKISYEAYKLIERMAKLSGESITETASALVAANLIEFKGAMGKLTEAIEGGELLHAPSGHESPSPVTSPGGAERQPGDQVGNPHDNTRKAESTEAVAEAIDQPMPDIDESGDRGEGSGLASPESEDGSGSLGGALISLGFLAYLAYWRWQRLGNQGFQANRGVM